MSETKERMPGCDLIPSAHLCLWLQMSKLRLRPPPQQEEWVGEWPPAGLFPVLSPPPPENLCRLLLDAAGWPAGVSGSVHRQGMSPDVPEGRLAQLGHSTGVSCFCGPLGLSRRPNGSTLPGQVAGETEA